MAKTSPVTFLKEVRTELRKVAWPNRQTIVRLTLIVVGISVAVGLFIGGLDYIFAKILGLVITK